MAPNKSLQRTRISYGGFPWRSVCAAELSRWAPKRDDAKAKCFVNSTMNTRVETGACFCGAIAAEMRGEPFWTCFDHDDDCRRAVGSPLSIWIGYRTDQFHLTRGLPKLFSKTKGVIRTFCARCGTSIGYLDEGLGDELYIAIGFMTHPERFKPQAHAYWKMRLPWLAFDDDLPRVDDYTRSRDSSFGNPIDRSTDHDPAEGSSSED